MPATADAPDQAPQLPPEDATLLTLARSARARTGATEGAALRDSLGRTYSAATVVLPSLRLSALQAAVAAAVSSGTDRVEAVCVLGESAGLAAGDRALVADLGGPAVLLAATDGTLRDT